MIVVFIVTFELYNFVSRVISDIADNASRFVFSDGLALFPDLLFNSAEFDFFKVLKDALRVSYFLTVSSKSHVNDSAHN